MYELEEIVRDFFKTKEAHDIELLLNCYNYPATTLPLKITASRFGVRA